MLRIRVVEMKRFLPPQLLLLLTLSPLAFGQGTISTLAGAASNALINNALIGSSACFVAYSLPLGVLYLVNDGGVDVGLPAALPLGATGSVSNSPGTIFSAGPSAVASCNSLVLTLNVTFTLNFTGNKVVYLAGRSVTNASSGWKTVGVSIVPEGIIAFPRSTDSSQSTSNTANATVSFNYQDTTDGNAASSIPLTVTLNIPYKPGFPANFGIWTAPNKSSGLTSPWEIVSVRKNPSSNAEQTTPRL
jgi:hypothetical protein